MDGREKHVLVSFWKESDAPELTFGRLFSPHVVADRVIPHDLQSIHPPNSRVKKRRKRQKFEQGER